MHILFYIYHAPAIVLAVTLLIVTHLVQVTAKLFALVLRRSSRNLVLRVLSELIKRRGALQYLLTCYLTRWKKMSENPFCVCVRARANIISIVT